MKVDTDKSKISVWLVKLPLFLADKVLELSGEHVIGELIIAPITKDSPPEIQFKISTDLTSQDLPTEYRLDFTDKEDWLYIFKEENEGFKIEGYINKEIFINPVLSEEYFTFVKSRAKINKFQSTTKVLNYLREGRQSEKFGSVSELEYLARKRKKILQSKKRERLDKNEVIDILFRAFEKHPAWTARDLADFSGQPVAFIQEILPEICVLNKRDYKNMYELKPEYKSNEQ